MGNMSIGGQQNIQRLAGDLKAAKQNGSIDPDQFIRDLTPKQLEKLGFDVDNGAFDFTGWSPQKIKTELKNIVKKADPTDPAPTDINLADYTQTSQGSAERLFNKVRGNGLLDGAGSAIQKHNQALQDALDM